MAGYDAHRSLQAKRGIPGNRTLDGGATWSVVRCYKRSVARDERDKRTLV